jgi:hypothetical protein
MELSKNTQLLCCKVIIGIALVNFVVFWIAAVCLGGDAANGKMYHGHYYLMSHGIYTEVSKAIFNYSKWHLRSVMITHPSALLAGLWYCRIKKQS